VRLGEIKAKEASRRDEPEWLQKQLRQRSRELHARESVNHKRTIVNHNVK